MELADQHGRVARDLRISLLDRCNLRCTYCMPEQGLQWAPKDTRLTRAEIARLARLAVDRLGVTAIRLTGGEPLLRKDLVDIVADLAALDEGRVDLSLTTNGVGLARLAQPLADAGLRRLNVSIDTLRPERFASLTRRDRLSDVMAGLAAARRAGLDPIKLNAVLLRDINADEAADLLHWALREGYQLRFIEQMPLEPHGRWSREAMVAADDILTALAARFDLTPHDPRTRLGAPAETFAVAPGADHPGGVVGVIASVTRPFCRDCSRTRITADGQVRNCLFARDETDLRHLMRSGADDDTVIATWQQAMWGKLPGHGIDDPAFLRPERPMSAIGG